MISCINRSIVKHMTFFFFFFYKNTVNLYNTLATCRKLIISNHIVFDVTSNPFIMIATSTFHSFCTFQITKSSFDLFFPNSAYASLFG